VPTCLAVCPSVCRSAYLQRVGALLDSCANAMQAAAAPVLPSIIADLAYMFQQSREPACLGAVATVAEFFGSSADAGPLLAHALEACYAAAHPLMQASPRGTPAQHQLQTDARLPSGSCTRCAAGTASSAAAACRRTQGWHTRCKMAQRVARWH
jgi:hypothetical protein